MGKLEEMMAAVEAVRDAAFDRYLDAPEASTDGMFALEVVEDCEVFLDNMSAWRREAMVE